MKKLSVAIIGCGNIFKNHAESINNSPYAELKAVVDVDKEKAMNYSKEYKCDMYIDYEDMLKREDIDVVHICTPHYLHCEMAIKSMQKGKNVFTEKPMGLNIEQHKIMIEKSKEYNKSLGVCFQNRFNNTSTEIKKIIDKKELGNILSIKSIITWFRNEKYYSSADWRGKFETEGGGLLINQAIHTLDLMLWFGGTLKSVRGNVSNRLLQDCIEVEDTADATLMFENEAIGIFYGTNCNRTDSPVELEISFERGILRLIDNELYIYDGKGKKLICSDNHDNLSTHAYWGNSHDKIINNFYKNILDGTHDFVSGEDSIRSIQLIDSIYKSSALNKMVKLNRLLSDTK